MTLNAPLNLPNIQSMSVANLNIVGSGTVDLPSVIMASGSITVGANAALTGTVTANAAITLNTIRVPTSGLLTVTTAGGGTVTGTVSALASSSSTISFEGGIDVLSTFNVGSVTTGTLTFKFATIRTNSGGFPATVAVNGPPSGSTTTVYANTFPNFNQWGGTVLIPASQTVTMISATITGSTAVLQNSGSGAFRGTVTLGAPHTPLTLTAARLDGATFITSSVATLTGSATAVGLVNVQNSLTLDTAFSIL